MAYNSTPTTFEDLLGMTLSSVELADGKSVLTFLADNGWTLTMLHHQDCCESVYVESIDGDHQDLVGTPILMAEEAYQRDLEADEHGSGCWTFYKLATIKGYVTIRWYGSSNGYYSTSVSCDWSNS